MISPNRSLADVCCQKALLWYEGGPQFDVNGVQKTANLGCAPGAPKLLTIGDGTTASTFPTQLVGKHGVSFDGGDYIDTGIVDPFERTDAFTLVVVISGVGAVCDVIGSVNAADANRGINLVLNNNNTCIPYFINQTSNNTYAAVIASVTTRATNAIAVTYTGTSSASGIKVYVNGESKSLSVSMDGLVGTVKSGKPFLLGVRHNGADKNRFMTGTMHFAAIFPWELTPPTSPVLRSISSHAN